MFRDSPLDHHIGKEIDHIVGADTTGGVDRKRLFGELVDQREDLDRSTIGAPIHDKVPTPRMIFVERAQPHTRSVGEPEPGALGLLLRHWSCPRQTGQAAAS